MIIRVKVGINFKYNKKDIDWNWSSGYIMPRIVNNLLKAVFHYNSELYRESDICNNLMKCITTCVHLL